MGVNLFHGELSMSEKGAIYFFSLNQMGKIHFMVDLSCLV